MRMIASTRAGATSHTMPDVELFRGELYDGLRVVGLLTSTEMARWGAMRAAMLRDFLARREAGDVTPMPRAPRLRTFARAAA